MKNIDGVCSKMQAQGPQMDYDKLHRADRTVAPPLVMRSKPGIVSYAIVEKDFGLAKPAKILKFELACGAERIVSRDIAYFSVACGAFPPFLLMKIAISSIFWAKFCLRR